MRKIILSFAIVLPVAVAVAFAKQNSAPAATSTVQPFLQEIIADYPGVRDIAISPSGSEVYFSLQSYAGDVSALVFVTMKDGSYSKAAVAPFSGRFHDLEPFFSADGLKLYFVSDRPLSDTARTAKDYDIWYVQRADLNSAWSAPVNMGAPVNTEENEFYPSVAASGNLYFTCDGKDSKGKDDIFVCKLHKGKYEARVGLPDSVNSAGYEFNAFIAPDESYLLYTCYNRAGGYGSGDLYISRNKGNNKWSAPVNLGKEINSPAMDYCPFYDEKTGNLYFTSKRNAVNTTFDSNQTLDELLREMNRPENGLSTLYRATYKVR